MPLRVRALLGTLALVIVMPGCARTREEAPRLRFTRDGESRDLSTALARGAKGPLPSGFSRLERACRESKGTRRCRIVGVGDDRRRAILLDVPSRVDLPIEAGEGDRFRFSAATVGSPPTAQELRVRVGEGPESPSWRARLEPGAPWVDGEIAVTRPGTQPLQIEIATPDGTSSDGAAVAIAAPRLVRPRADDEPAGPTNVLLYLIDTLRADHTSVGGSSRPTTPHLEDLAHSGVVFERAYSTAAHTRPSTASVMTSLYPSQHGAWRGRGLSPSVETLAERFREAGWSTWAFVTNGQVFDPALNFDQGFDRFQTIRGQRRDNHARTEEVNDLLLPQLDAIADEPFFLYVHVVDPHSPYDPPESTRGRFSDPAYGGPIVAANTRRTYLQRRTLGEDDLTRIRDLYDEDILYQDEMLGVLLERLRRLGLFERTLIVILADHGEEFHEHGGWEHGKRLWEEQIHVPLVLASGAATMPKGRRVDTPVSLVDVMPTLLSLFSIDVPGQSVGQDLGELLRGEKATVVPRPIYAEEAASPIGPLVRSFAQGRWKIIEWLRPSNHQLRRETALFDLAGRREAEDVGARRPERLAELSDALGAHKRSLAARRPLPTAAPAQLDPRTKEQLRALGYADGD